MIRANNKNKSIKKCKLNDKELICNLINENDISAYNELWSRYKKPINFLINKMIKNKQDAEELTSEAICKAFLNIKKFDFNYCFSTWLYRISTNAAIDFMRKKKLKTESISKFSRGDESEEFELPIEDGNLNPLESIIRNEIVEIVNQAIDDLDDNSANLLRLKHITGKTYLEIAKENNLPIGTVKTHVFRATKLIEQNLRTQKDLLR